MKFDFISRLKAIFSRLALHRMGKPGVQRASVERPITLDDGRYPSASDYELYYWCSAPAPWY
ncbi:MULTISPECIES: hypothetical protein [Rhizobium]|uniref:Uncharacterized protein n=1 Tax=Rhizobium paranaense TaxID=1650438 RepID=A0A7W8XRI9_9HYPH|nr:hypothetical protein [Rhizobium paranaense]MBB5574246.1 hypothetical protein [Rhizobium paranaense]